MINQSGGAKITIQKISSVPEFKKPIYKKIQDSGFTNQNYTDIVQLYNYDELIQNVDKITKNKDNNQFKLLRDFNRLTTIDSLYESTTFISIVVNNLYNNGNMAFIQSTIDNFRMINNIDGSNKFDIFIDKMNLPDPDKMDKEVTGMKVVNQVYGSYSKLNTVTYPDLLKEGNKYENVAISNASSKFRYYPTIFSICQMPTVFMKLILGLFLLKDKGNIFIHMKTCFNYPLMQQYMDLLFYLFDNVDLEKQPNSKFNIFLHCSKLNKAKFNKLELELSNILTELGKHQIKPTKDIISHYYSGNGSKDIDIAYKVELNVPNTNSSNTLLDIMENYFYGYINDIHYLVVQHTPMSEDSKLNILEKQTYKYVTGLVQFLEQHKIPYNKYYLNFINDYYEHIYKNMYSFTNNINMELINYPMHSISMKKSKSVTKRDRRSQVKSIRQSRDFLKRIEDGEAFNYEEFVPSIQKLGYIKQTRKTLLNKLDSSKLKRVTRVTEDFTQGISIYLYKRFNMDIIPSNAYTKLWEIYSQFELIPGKETIRTFHLAEAPGQFIKATQHFIKARVPKCKRHCWKANSLNPNNKEIIKEYGRVFKDDYGLMKGNPENWLWGEDNTGDITRSKNIRWFRDHLKKWVGKDKIDVITGDAGLELDFPAVKLQKLDYAQCVLAAATCSMGKHCVIKTFTPFLGNKPETLEAGGFFVGLLFLYSLLWKNVYLVKPYTSRATSGEYYIVGKNFTGLPDFALNKLLGVLDNFKINQTLFPKNIIPDSFVKQCVKFIEQMTNHNVDTIERQLFFFSCANDTGKVLSDKTNCQYYLNPRNLTELHQQRYKKWVNQFKFRYVSFKEPKSKQMASLFLEQFKDKKNKKSKSESKSKSKKSKK